MAGDIYIESLSYDDIENIERCGGVVEKKVFHADRSNFSVLAERLTAAVQNRKDLPPHCYITFQKNGTDATRLLRLSSILQRTSRPAGIVKMKQGLINWDASNDVQKAKLLWGELQSGPIALEFYKVGLWSVKTHFKQFEMCDER